MPSSQEVIPIDRQAFDFPAGTYSISPQLQSIPGGCSVSAATPNRKRGKRMSRRSGQQGTVVKKGNMWHGRYYVDVVGQDERKRVSLPIGSVDAMTKSEAKRRLRATLEENGINTEAHFIRTTVPGRSFAQEVEWWRENRLSLFKPSCQETMGGHIDKYLLPRFGKMPLDSIHERQAQEFVAQLNRTEYRQGKKGKRKKLSPKSIRNIIGVLKLVLGVKVWREWRLSLPE